MEDLRMKAKTLWASLPSLRSKKEQQSIEQAPTKPYDGPPLPATVIMHQIGSFLDHDTWHTLRSCCSDLYQESKSTVPSSFPSKMMKVTANAKQAPPKIAYTLHKGLLVLVTLELTSREEAVQEGDNTMAGTLDGDPDTPVVTLSVAIYRKSRNRSSPKSKLFAFVLEDGVPWSSLDVQLSMSISHHGDRVAFFYSRESSIQYLSLWSNLFSIISYGHILSFALGRVSRSGYK